MAKASTGQRKTEGRIMHEFKHGELKSGKAGRGGKVKSRKQAIAIALHEAGASKYDSPAKRKEAKGKTYQQEREGKSHVGARGKRESTRAMGGKNAKTVTRRRTSAARAGGTRKTMRATGRTRKAS